MESVWDVAFAYKYCSDSSYIFLSKSRNNPGKLNQSTSSCKSKIWKYLK